MQSNLKAVQKEEWRQISKEKCLCGGGCSCHCCALCWLIVWIIAGAILLGVGVFLANFYEDYFTAPCDGEIDDGLNSYDECCCHVDGLESICIVNVKCETLEAVYVTNIVDSSFQIIAGISGIIGICGFISWLLLIPVGYAIVTLILPFWYMAVTGWEFIYYYATGMILSILIIILFFINWKIMRDAQKKPTNDYVASLPTAVNLDQMKTTSTN